MTTTYLFSYNARHACGKESIVSVIVPVDECDTLRDAVSRAHKYFGFTWKGWKRLGLVKAMPMDCEREYIAEANR